MKVNYLFFILLFIVFSCKKNEPVVIKSSIDSIAKSEVNYPKFITKVFDAHGGLKQWKGMRTLVFTMNKPDGKEVTTTALKSRKSLIQMPKHAIVFDGEKVWLHKKDTTAYKGNPKFYYNLMFYFYAMPFILADDGIVYEEVKPLHFNGLDYPGVKISYETGIGESPDDEYILYYHPETYKMEWLGYTVTYFSKEKSKDFHFIKYKDWQSINGLVLPKTMVWYNYENNVPTTERNAVDFEDVQLSKNEPKENLFLIPANAEIIE